MTLAFPSSCAALNSSIFFFFAKNIFSALELLILLVCLSVIGGFVVLEADFLFVAVVFFGCFKLSFPFPSSVASEGTSIEPTSPFSVIDIPAFPISAM